MECKACGKKILNPSAKFCRHCGASVVNASARSLNASALAIPTLSESKSVTPPPTKVTLAPGEVSNAPTTALIPPSEATLAPGEVPSKPSNSKVKFITLVVIFLLGIVGAGAWMWNSKEQTDTQIAELKKKAEEEATARQRLEQEASKRASKGEDASQKDEALNASKEREASENKASEEDRSKATNQNEAQPTAAPSTVVSCLNIGDCYSATLLAMSKNDIEAVRRIAEKIDAFEKPARGNRTVARKLNEEGLSVFRKDDFSQASAVLTKAQREDPSDVEIASNLGFARVKAADYSGAHEALMAALLLNPRRTSTWIPIAELIARQNQSASGVVSALLIAYEWSTGREKAIEYYTTQANTESNPQLKLAFGEALQRIARQSSSNK